MIISVLISALISLGIITTDADYHNASAQQQQEYQNIIVDDMLEL